MAHQQILAHKPVRDLRPDDRNPVTFRAREVSLRSQLDGHVTELLNLRKSDVVATLTDLRVALAVNPNAQHGQMDGEVDLSWIVAVGGSTGARRMPDQLRIIVQRMSGGYLVLDLALAPEQQDVHALAAAIARRTAEHWLVRHREETGEVAETWVRLATAAPLLDSDEDAGDFHLHWMPEAQPVPDPSLVCHLS